MPAIEGAIPLTKIGSANTSIPLPVPAINKPPMKGSYTLPEFVPKNQGLPIWRMILDEERGRVRGALPLKGLTPLTKIGFANASISSSIPQ